MHTLGFSPLVGGAEAEVSVFSKKSFWLLYTSSFINGSADPDASPHLVSQGAFGLV